MVPVVFNGNLVELKGFFYQLSVGERLLSALLSKTGIERLNMAVMQSLSI